LTYSDHNRTVIKTNLVYLKIYLYFLIKYMIHIKSSVTIKKLKFLEHLYKRNLIYYEIGAILNDTR